MAEDVGYLPALWTVLERELGNHGVIGSKIVKAGRHLAEGAQSMEQGDNRLVGRVEATETNVPQCAVPSRIVWIVTGSPRDTSGQIFQGPA